jgi:hypothetical protein
VKIKDAIKVMESPLIHGALFVEYKEASEMAIQALEKQILKEPEELVKEAIATIKEFCEEKPNCKGCTLHDEVADGCKLDSIPADWKLD